MVPAIIIIFGGLEIHQELIFSPTKDVLNGPIDIAVLHDGELIFSQIIEHILTNKSLATVPSIYYKKDGVLHKTIRNSTFDLSLLPSPILTHVIPSIGIKTNQIIIENSRGCPFRCSYCTYPLSYFGTLRYFPISKTLAELQFLLKKRLSLYLLLMTILTSILAGQ